jgi:hypothetical protein
MRNQTILNITPSRELSRCMAFRVVVKTPDGIFPFTAIDSSSGAAAAAAIDRYGICSVSVHPVRPA